MLRGWQHFSICFNLFNWQIHWFYCGNWGIDFLTARQTSRIIFSQFSRVERLRFNRFSAQLLNWNFEITTWLFACNGFFLIQLFSLFYHYRSSSLHKWTECFDPTFGKLAGGAFSERQLDCRLQSAYYHTSLIGLWKWGERLLAAAAPTLDLRFGWIFNCSKYISPHSDSSNI